jgi:hypothetical protein
MQHTAVRTAGALLAAAPLTLVAPSHSFAADDARHVGPRFAMVTPETPPPTLVGPQRRTIHSRVVGRGERLVLRGDVEGYSRRRVIVQRKKCHDCGWQRHEVVLTGDHGWFRSRIGAPKQGSTYWRAKVPASNGYVRSYSATWETYY